ncbi:hypothetical protein LEAN103870_12370 [Legionella anisa]|nr:hypothetical protein Lani_3394 [Legionella anisa]
MWFPNIDLDKWVSIFPRLKYECPIFCLCGLELSGFKAFVTQNWVGIISERCECGMEGSSCSIPRNRDYSQKIKDKIHHIFNYSF